MKGKTTWTVLAPTLGAVIAGSAAADTGQPSTQADSYRYALTAEKAHECSLAQGVLSTQKAESNPEWSRNHKAMATVWALLARDLKGGGWSREESAQALAKIRQELPGNQLTSAGLTEWVKDCQIIKSLNSAYNVIAMQANEDMPELFAGDAGRKLQTAGEFAETPSKDLSFEDWTFTARGNSCRAVHQSETGAKLTFGFTNFFDGSISLEWDQLPILDMESDDYYDDLRPHREGGAFDDESGASIFAEGVTYDSYPGTGIFVDGELVAQITDAVGGPQEYVFGAYIQDPYYNQLAQGQQLTIKVLGKEILAMDNSDPAFWNEMSNCMAQYPFG